MTREEAIEIYERYLKRSPPTGIVPTEMNGSWVFVDNAPRYAGYAVRPDKQVIRFHGALGGMVGMIRQLGAPKTIERTLGNTSFGRYQAFDGGVAVWEGSEDFAYPVLESLNPLPRQLCIVSFFDLRGFTLWAANAGVGQVQTAVEVLEAAVHEGFPVARPFERLFLKGTGDGVMIVSQADWYPGPATDQWMDQLAAGHGQEFLHACERSVIFGKKELARYDLPLAVGCGISVGELNRVFLFGRMDFLGAAANDAAKLQQLGWNEVCVTDAFANVLNAEGRSMTAERELAGKAWRLKLSE